MGCVVSSIENEERVRICRERKRLMKQLVEIRGEFADAQLAYLRALKNTGVTLRQFTESESLELETNPFVAALPSSPPPPLPPSPPPPPPLYSPDLRKFGKAKMETTQEEIQEIDEDSSSCTPPPAPDTWGFWDPFAPSSPHHPHGRIDDAVEAIEDESWAEANTEFEEDGEEEVVCYVEKPKPVELGDGNCSTLSWYSKDTSDSAMVVWKSKKTLAGIIRELDDYFLKASAGGIDISVLMNIDGRNTCLWQTSKEHKSKKSNSAKVFSALTGNRSSRSLQFSREAVDICSTTDPCRPGSHSITLEKLFTEEQRLYKEVKEEEYTKIEHEKKSLILRKQEDEDYDWTKTEKTRSTVESLHFEILRLQQSIGGLCSTILKLRDEELHPQLITLTSGMANMWQTMSECHQFQKYITEQVNHLVNQQSLDPTSNYHWQAAGQLKNEVASWYNSFCKLMESQRDYVKALSQWIRLTDCLAVDVSETDRNNDDCVMMDGSTQRNGSRRSSSSLHALCDKWQLALDKLPDKVASEAIKNLLTVINSIVSQQEIELNLKNKSDKLEIKLQRELISLADLEEGSSETAEQSLSNPKHPLSVKRAKIDVLKKQVDDLKAKYLDSVQVTKAMTLNNLKTSLANVFQALMGFSSAYAQHLEAIHGGGRVKPGNYDEGSVTTIGEETCFGA